MIIWNMNGIGGCSPIPQEGDHFPISRHREKWDPKMDYIILYPININDWIVENMIYDIIH